MPFFIRFETLDSPYISFDRVGQPVHVRLVFKTVAQILDDAVPRPFVKQLLEIDQHALERFEFFNELLGRQIQYRILSGRTLPRVSQSRPLMR